MSKETEDRLRRALAERAEQVTAESLRPAELASPSTASRAAWGSFGRSSWTRWAPAVAAAAAVTVIAGVALLDRPTSDEAPPAGSPEVVTGSSCPREADLVAAALRDGSVLADVDGDGAPDRIVTAVDPDAAPRCRAFVG